MILTIACPGTLSTLCRCAVPVGMTARQFVTYAADMIRGLALALGVSVLALEWSVRGAC